MASRPRRSSRARTSFSSSIAAPTTASGPVGAKPTARGPASKTSAGNLVAIRLRRSFRADAEHGTTCATDGAARPALAERLEDDKDVEVEAAECYRPAAQRIRYF